MVKALKDGVMLLLELPERARKGPWLERCTQEVTLQEKWLAEDQDLFRSRNKTFSNSQKY